MKERLIRFSLFGQEFSFYSDADQDEVDRVIALVREEFEDESGKMTVSIPSSKMLVLGCLRIAARYVELEKEYGNFRKRQGHSIDQLIEKMTSGIKD